MRNPIHHGHALRRAQSRTYRTWANMVQRCTNPKNPAYKYYGGRGIAICERWAKFENFLADMGLRPEGLTLDRINNDGNYEPNNCRWATRAEQSHNSTRPCHLTHKGKTQSIRAWARELGIGREQVEELLRKAA